MASVTYVFADGERLVLGPLSDQPNVTIFHDASGNALVIATASGDTMSFDFGTTAVAVLDATSLRVGGGILSSDATAGIGYRTGAGGTVTQASNKTTGVTLNTVTGTVTTNNAALAAAAEATFTVTDSAVAITDSIVCSVQSGGTSGEYLAHASAVAAGSFDITLANMSASSASDAVLINFAVIKGVVA